MAVNTYLSTTESKKQTEQKLTHRYGEHFGRWEGACVKKETGLGSTDW